MVDKSEKFRWLVRVGYAARGLVYLLIGYLALAQSRGDKGPEGAFNYLQDVPLGKPILYLAAVGLLAYGLYRFCSLFFDIENRGSSGKGIAYRVGAGAAGVAYLALAWTALQFASGDKRAPTDGGGSEEAAGSLLTFALGPVVLGLIGIGFIIAAAVQAKSAFTGSFMKRISPRAPRIIDPVGRVGLASRAVVFVIVGWSLVQSAWLTSESQVKTLGEAVNSLADKGTLYTIIAVGLMLFGIYSLLAARYRIIPDLDEGDLRPRLR